MAHSTWFQASMWPSGQPIAPDASCPAAMACPVARISCSLSTLATDGTVPATALAYCPVSTWDRFSGTGRSLRGRDRHGPGPDLLWLACVHNDALADERVERPLGGPGQRRVLHDVPDQQPVVSAGQRVGVVVHADRALQPPVRRVQPVRPVMPADLETGGAQL